MSEPPDFEQLARAFAERAFPTAVVTVPKAEWSTRTEMVAGFAEELRQVWNARGAADRATVDHDLSTQMGATAAGPYVKNLDRALRSLDR